MPTVFIHNGYRVSFYSYDLAERMHVHVFKSGANAKSGWMILRLPSTADSSRMKSPKSGGWSRNAARKSSNDGLNMGAMRIRVLL